MSPANFKWVKGGELATERQRRKVIKVATVDHDSPELKLTVNEGLEHLLFP